MKPRLSVGKASRTLARGWFYHGSSSAADHAETPKRREVRLGHDPAELPREGRRARRGRDPRRAAGRRGTARAASVPGSRHRRRLTSGAPRVRGGGAAGGPADSERGCVRAAAAGGLKTQLYHHTATKSPNFGYVVLCAPEVDYIIGNLFGAFFNSIESPFIIVLRNSLRHLDFGISVFCTFPRERIVACTSVLTIGE